ncbi:MAG: hypothetical protein ACFB3T_04300 [Geminicoccaceae bacterium]
MPKTDPVDERATLREALAHLHDVKQRIDSSPVLNAFAQMDRFKNDLARLTGDLESLLDGNDHAGTSRQDRRQRIAELRGQLRRLAGESFAYQKLIGAARAAIMATLPTAENTLGYSSLQRAKRTATTSG